MNPKEWRQAENLTLEDLAARMGYEGTGYLSEVETGIKRPSGRILFQYHKLSNGKVGLSDFDALQRAS